MLPPVVSPLKMRWHVFFCSSSSSVFYPPAAERFSPLVKVVLSRERQSTGWDRQMDAEAQNQPQQVDILQHIIGHCLLICFTD